MKTKSLSCGKPGSQTRRFTHIKDTVRMFEAWKKINHVTTVFHKKSCSIINAAKMFNTKIVYLKPSWKDMPQL